MTPDLGLLQQALFGIKQLRGKLDSATREPIAIIGMGCRFPPNCRTPEEYWKLLEAERGVRNLIRIGKPVLIFLLHFLPNMFWVFGFYILFRFNKKMDIYSNGLL